MAGSDAVRDGSGPQTKVHGDEILVKEGADKLSDYGGISVKNGRPSPAMEPDETHRHMTWLVMDLSNIRGSEQIFIC
jgi:hypothetical protein